MKKVILGGLLFVGGTIMYSIGTLGFADMDVQAGYMLTPQYIGVAVMLLGLGLCGKPILEIIKAVAYGNF